MLLSVYRAIIGPTILDRLIGVNALIIFVTGWRYKRLAYPLSLIAMSVCLLSSAFILAGVINNGTLQYLLGGWKPPWGIEYRVDHLNAGMLTWPLAPLSINLTCGISGILQDLAAGCLIRAWR